MSLAPAATSAPGKVFLAGGFLVLDRAHTALVFGLNARIHVHVSEWPDRSSGSPQVLVRSPQFRDTNWLYNVEVSNKSSKNASVKQDIESGNYTKSSNKFVETTLLYVLTYLLHTSKDITRSTRVTILADDDYYSQSSSSSLAEQSDGGKKKFTDFGVKLSDAHKTGLGSSAALTTALTASLLSFYGNPSSTDQLPLKTVHNLAQAAHCAAQGKVGSGFDVATATYGSCLYRRFTPAILEKVGEPASEGFGERLHRCIEDLDLEQKWDEEIASHAVQVPDSLLLVMCDVDCGSETPGMVRNVLKWRKENPEEAGLLWMALQQGTEDLCQELTRLARVEGIKKGDFGELGDIIQTIRSMIREMSQKSKVPIEPPVITKLLDYCTSSPGVVGGVCPGAGGYDAVALLIKNDSETVKELEAKLDGWKSDDAHGAVIGKVRLLGVKQEKDGLKHEDVSVYEGWI